MLLRACLSMLMLRTLLCGAAVVFWVMYSAGVTCGLGPFGLYG